MHSSSTQRRQTSRAAWHVCRNRLHLQALPEFGSALWAQTLAHKRFVRLDFRVASLTDTTEISSLDLSDRLASAERASLLVADRSEMAAVLANDIDARLPENGLR